MLFLSVVGRIHVEFASGAPVFWMVPRGPVHLTKDSALTTVWVLTLLYGLLVFVLAYRRPNPDERVWAVTRVVGVIFAVALALAEPLWGLVGFADVVGMEILRRLAAGRQRAS